MSVGRFQVMACLQAARAYALGLPPESAYSWGLNRAIFYAAAKRGFKGGTHGPVLHKGTLAKPLKNTTKKVPGTYYLGDEFAFKEEKKGTLFFTIGGKVQTDKDFETQVRSRFGGAFKQAWEEAVDYVKHFDKETLLSGRAFYEDVYKLKRDEFAEKWSELSERASTKDRIPIKR